MMDNKCLTFDEIMEFLSVDELNEKTEIIINRVNSHIAHCVECRDTVRAYQTIADEFSRLAREKCLSGGEDLEYGTFVVEDFEEDIAVAAEKIDKDEPLLDFRLDMRK